MRNPHRTSWVGQPGTKGRVCTAPDCGFKAATPRQQTDHADHFEPVRTRGPR